MAGNSLNSVVSGLVRASMGSSLPSTVTDDELDRHVQELILKEAKKKAEHYSETGVRAYLPEREDKQPRANKRFLSSIIRHTDDHNKAVIKAQTDAAFEVKRAREEQEREERRARAAEATEAERRRRQLGRSLRNENGWDRTRDSGRRRRRSLSEECHARDAREQDRKKQRHHSRSTSRHRNDDGERRRRRKDRHRDEDDRDKTRSNHARRHLSRSPTAAETEDHTSPKKGRSLRYEYENGRENSAERRRKTKGKGKESLDDAGPSLSVSRTSTPIGNSQSSSEAPKPESSTSRVSPKPPSTDLSAQFESRKARAASPPAPASPTLSEEEDIERLRPRRRRRSPKADRQSPPSNDLSSKMDKYFEQSYDPRLDSGPLTMPEIPATGLIDGAEFEGWEAMLDIIRQRREDKVERKRLERAGLIPSGDRDKSKVVKSSSSEAWTMDSGPSVMDIKYSKRGAVREWDVGKEGF